MIVGHDEEDVRSAGHICPSCEAVGSGSAGNHGILAGDPEEHLWATPSGALRCRTGCSSVGPLQLHLGRCDRYARYASGAIVGDMTWPTLRSEEHTSELTALMRTSYDVLCLKKKKTKKKQEE